MRISTWLLPLLCFATSLVAADWPQHLGPNRNGAASVAEAELPGAFDADVSMLWSAPVGRGFAGPVVVDGRVLIFHRKGDEAILTALDAGTGGSLWEYRYETDYVDSFGFDDGPRAIPAVSEGVVYVHGSEGQVHAVDLGDGTRRWSYDTVAELGSGQGFFGRAGAPLVTGGMVIIPAGGSLDGESAGLVALDAKEGSVRWVGVDDEAGYSAPVLGPSGQLIVWMRNRLWVVDAGTGETLDSVPFRSDMNASVNACTPLVMEGDRVFASAGYGVGAGLWEVSEKGQLKELWVRQDWLDCHYGTPVAYKGRLYGFDGRQETGQTLRSVDLESGRVVWNSEQIPGGTLLRVGQHLAVVTEQGELWVVPTGNDSFGVSLRQQLFRSGHRSHPAFSNGVLYARDRERLVAVRLVP
jgi:outer membrane protein assembly factor BamB